MLERLNYFIKEKKSFAFERRYGKGIKNFSKYINEADSWYLYDNSGTEYVLIAKD